MPVDSIATVLTPHSASQSASRCRSAVQAPNERTLAGKCGGWPGGGEDTDSDPTATQWMSEWMSMPAACGWVTRSRPALPGRGGFAAVVVALVVASLLR